MNTIERESLKADLNGIIDQWLKDTIGEITLPTITEDTATYMATAALAVLDALQDIEKAEEAEDTDN